MSALHVVAELLDAQVGSQQLTVKGCVLPLCVGELPPEEGEWAPGEWAPGEWAPGEWAPGEWAPGPVAELV